MAETQRIEGIVVVETYFMINKKQETLIEPALCVGLMNAANALLEECYCAFGSGNPFEIKEVTCVKLRDAIIKLKGNL